MTSNDLQNKKCFKYGLMHIRKHIKQVYHKVWECKDDLNQLSWDHLKIKLSIMSVMGSLIGLFNDLALKKKFIVAGQNKFHKVVSEVSFFVGHPELSKFWY